MVTITPFLWFDTQAEEAASFYVSLFKNSEITGISRYGDAGPAPAGSVMTVSFTLDGSPFTAINGGPAHAEFNKAISFQIDCADQAEVDHFWDAFVEGGQEDACGWVQDRYGLSWQVIPRQLFACLGGDDAAGAQRAMQAMLGMKRLVVADLESAYAG